MKIINFKSVEKGFLKGFFDVVIEEWGLTMACSFFEKDAKKWVTLPNRKFEKDGVAKYQPLVKFDEGRHKKFQEKVIQMIEAGQYEKLEIKPAPTPMPMDEDAPF